MQVVNKQNAVVFELVISNFKGIEVFAHIFTKGEPLIVFGDNGAGKTAIILALYAALDKRKIPIKYDSLVGPYSIDAIKKAKVKLGIEGDSGIMELNGKTLEKFYVNFSITASGTVNLSLTDAITGEVDKSPSKEKIKNLLGLFLDPVDLAATLEEPHGDRKMAEKLAAMVGLDLSPYVKREEALFAEKQEENVTRKILKGKFADLDKPQDDWPTKYIDPASISGKLQKLNEFNTKEEEKIRTIKLSLNEYTLAVETKDKIADEILTTSDNVIVSKKDFDGKTEKLSNDKVLFEQLKTEHKPEGWLDIQSAEKIDEEIRLLTEKAHKMRAYDKAISERTNSIIIATEKVSQSKKSFDEKSELHKNKKLEKTKHDGIVADKKESSEKVTEENKPLDWSGEKDPEGIKTPLQFLTDKMATVEKDNIQVNNAKKYYEDEEGIKLVEKSIKDIDAKRAQNTNEKLAKVSSVDFPMEGITVDENTVWYDSNDGRGKQTILDRSEGERMRICTHILIAGNTGPLNVIVVRQGHALSQRSQEIIFEVAAEYGYTVILETIIAERPGAVKIVAGNIGSIIPPKLVSDEPVEEKKDEDDSFPKMNW
jgi:hypothetical protein